MRQPRHLIPFKRIAKTFQRGDQARGQSRGIVPFQWSQQMIIRGRTMLHLAKRYLVHGWRRLSTRYWLRGPSLSI